MAYPFVVFSAHEAQANMNRDPIPETIRGLSRPDPALWTYYIIRAILTGPGILASLPYLYFRYHTLKYRFDEEGIHMKVGILFRREVNLTYSRIQDIHLRSGLIQRWFGLANVQIQTASGSSGPELIVEGFKEFEAIRDFLYTRMRGYQSHKPSLHAETEPKGQARPGQAVEIAEVLSLLANIRDELHRTREIVESRTNQPSPTSPSNAAPPAAHV
jgi:putative membrane protein